MAQDQVIKWCMSITFLVAALFLSSNFAYSKIGYILFGLGHIQGIYVFRQDPAMFWHNILFGAIDIWGIYRWWFA